MATYEYRCRTCGVSFTVARPMSALATMETCPEGHQDVARVWSAVAISGRASASGGPPASGGCCGGACGCR